MEFPSYTIESKIPGPTVVVVGGLQGNEPVGWNTANKIRQWSIDSGKLVVLPQVNPVAIQRGTYVGRNGDLNDHFPPGRKPTTKLARAVWSQVKQANPDVFFSLHSSHGILGVKEGPDGVGQAIYPTYIGQARKNASQTVQFMNKQYLDSMRPVYDFKIGNTLDADRPLLTHKVAGDLKIPGYLVETTRYGTDLKTETKWMTAMVANLIRQSGIDIQR
ncbi:deacylase [halophilic archaeon]|nr:deacylase [halophilic archaeon]